MKKEKCKITLTLECIINILKGFLVYYIFRTNYILFILGIFLGEFFLWYLSILNFIKINPQQRHFARLFYLFGYMLAMFVTED